MAFAIHSSALIALSSAASWGGGDFSGGMGVKTSGGRVPDAIRFVLLAHAISLTALLAIAHTLPFPGLPGHTATLWAILAGLTGALGLVAFYIALSRGGMGTSAALSGLLAAAIPAVASSLLEGVPSALRLAGFALAGGAIWLIAAGSSPEGASESRSTMALAVFAGVMFGIYFIALKMANPLGLVASMALARITSITLCSLVLGTMAFSRRRRPPSPQAQPAASGPWMNRPGVWGWACAVALLDTGGNLLFMAATRAGRLDVASVLASLYPAGTILLAAWVLKERPTQRQVLGMLTALAAVAMITLQM